MILAKLAAITALTTALPSFAQDSMDEIIVTGVRSADQNARNQERASTIFSSVIATDDFGNFTDQNIAESLRRLPGITLERSEGEGKYVSLRGLGPGFVSVSQNGTELATADSDERDFALDALSLDTLGTIEVFKTLTPDQDLNSIAGRVNVKSISAFDRGRNSFKLKAQTSYSDRRDNYGSKYVISGTQLFLSEQLGAGYSLSYESRDTQVDEVRNHSTGDMIFWTQNIEAPANAPVVLGPRQLETRQEIADREKISATLNLEYRLGDSGRIYARSSYSNFEDIDVARREFFDFQDAGGGEVAYANPQTLEFALSDIDVFQQYFIQESDNQTGVLALGGEHRVNDWQIDYEYAISRGDQDKPNGRRVQFREADLVVLGQGSGRNIRGRVITADEAAALGGFDVSDFSSSDIRGAVDADNINAVDNLSLDNMHFDNLFLENTSRDDKLQTLNFNFRKDINSGSLNYLKAGLAFSERERIRNKDRFSFDPDDGPAGCGSNQACLDAINSNHGDYPNFRPSGSNFTYPFVVESQIEAIIAASRLTTGDATNGEVSIDSTKEDYTINEDTSALYIMAEFQLSDGIQLIAGGRYVDTKYESTGFFSVENDDFQFAGDGFSNLDIAIPLNEGSNSYSDFFPSLHLRWEPTDNILVRTALWTSFTRPSFSQGRSFAKIDSDIELCNPATGDCDDDPDEIGNPTSAELQNFVLAEDNSIQIGNPNLIAMTSTNFDASIGWYPSENLFLQAAVFYKDIDDFIVDITGVTRALNDLPVTLPTSQVTQFVIPADLVLTDVDTTINGDKAKVKGIELSYTQYFNSGFFLQSNLTLLDSKATLDNSFRAGSIQLPDQADQAANLVVGWENERASARFIGNYTSEILQRIGACSADDLPPAGQSIDPTDCKIWADMYQDENYSIDFKATLAIGDRYSIYFDAINITDEADLKYFQGNELSGGRVLYQLETYGRSYQLGLNVDF